MNPHVRLTGGQSVGSPIGALILYFVQRGLVNKM